MITKIFSIYDTKAKAYNTPFYMLQEGQALRGFMDLVNDPQTSISKHPSDYILFMIGTFDDQTSITENTVPPVQLGVGSAFKEIGVPYKCAPETSVEIGEAVINGDLALESKEK